MTSPSEVYNSLFAGQKLTIAFADRRAYESLRVALCQAHQTPKLLLEVTDDSLCASFDASQSLGTFWIGPPRKPVRRAAFTIVSSEDISNG